MQLLNWFKDDGVNDQKNIVLIVQEFSRETDGMLMENNAGSARLVVILIAGTIIRQGTPKSRNGLNAGLSKVTRFDNWRAKVDIARGSFTV